MTTTQQKEVKGMSYTTGMVHRALPAGPEGQLKQLCGMMRKQVAFLAKVEGDPAVTCKRCNGLP